MNERFAARDARGGRHRPGVRVHPGLSPGARRGDAPRAAPRSHHRAVLAHPVAGRRGVPPSCRGGARCSKACSPTTCIGFHIRPHALNFLETVAETLEARVDHERPGGRARWPAHLGATFPDRAWTPRRSRRSPNPRPTREAMQELRDQLGLHDCRGGTGRGPTRLHQGHPRPARGARAPVRAASGMDRHAWRSSRSGCLRASSSRRTARCRSARARSPSASIERFPRAGGPTVHLIEIEPRLPRAGPLLPPWPISAP